MKIESESERQFLQMVGRLNAVQIEALDIFLTGIANDAPEYEATRTFALKIGWDAAHAEHFARKFEAVSQDVTKPFRAAGEPPPL